MSNELKKHAEENKILEIRCGSHLYGTNTPESDEDYVGVFLPSIEQVLGFEKVKEVSMDVVDKNELGRNTKDAVDKKLYEFRHFCNLAMANNPTILEVLFVNEKNLLHQTINGSILLGYRDLFPSKQMVRGYLGYAEQQEHKMTIRSDKFKELELGFQVLGDMDNKEVMADVLLEYPCLFKIKNNDLKYIWCGDVQIERGTFVSKARKMIKRRVDSASSRKELVRKYGYDTKFGSHLIRLLEEGLEFLRTGTLEFPLQNRAHLLDIKTGKYEMGQVIEMSEKLRGEYPKAEEESKLPNVPEIKRIEQFVINIIKWDILNN